MDEDQAVDGAARRGGPWLRRAGGAVAWGAACAFVLQLVGCPACHEPLTVRLLDRDGGELATLDGDLEWSRDGGDYRPCTLGGDAGPARWACGQRVEGCSHADGEYTVRATAAAGTFSITVVVEESTCDGGQPVDLATTLPPAPASPDIEPG